MGECDDRKTCPWMIHSLLGRRALWTTCPPSQFAPLIANPPWSAKFAKL